MFDIAFSEMVVIGIVTLVVVGPKRLPTLARTAGRWLGHINRYVTQVKSDIQHQMDMEKINELKKEFTSGADDFKNELSHIETRVQHEVSSLEMASHDMTKPLSSSFDAIENPEANPIPTEQSLVVKQSQT